MDFFSGLSHSTVAMTIGAYFLGLLTFAPMFFSSIFLVEPKPHEARFRSKKLIAKDEVIIDMLNATTVPGVAWSVTDPNIEDNPIIFASDGFCTLTKYDRHEIVGKNCRFLQGPKTNKEDIKAVRDAIKNQDDISICLINHKKDGTKFNNQFFLCPLFGPESKTKPVYYLGVQTEVTEYKSGQNDMNIGWIYSMGNHK